MLTLATFAAESSDDWEWLRELGWPGAFTIVGLAFAFVWMTRD